MSKAGSAQGKVNQTWIAELIRLTGVSLLAIAVLFGQGIGAFPAESAFSKVQRARAEIETAATFADVPPDHPYYEYIEAIYQAGFTAGCSSDPLLYCPEATMNRAESAVFVERGIHTASYDPPTPASQVFADLPLDSWAAGWVDGLWDDGYTAGCGTNPLLFCSWQGHTRAEAAVFYLRMLRGADYTPAQPTASIFADVPMDSWYARWVHEAYNAGLIEPCEVSPQRRYCPDAPLTRAIAAYMMAQAKGLMPSGIVPVRLEFAPSNEDFPNPERGFMKQSSIYPDQALDPNKIRALQPSDSLVWIYFRLDNYRTRPLDPDGLTTIRSVFDIARSRGLKLVIRFIYNWGPGWTLDPNQATADAPIDLVLQHIDQLRPILADNSDVLAVVQAGFVGHWGEWHSTKYLHPLEYRRAIVDALLRALPKDRMLQLRYPRYKEILYQGPLTPQEAFSGTDQSRIGHHNDCFLADQTDGGTYLSVTYQVPTHGSNYCDGRDEIGCWKDFIAQEGQFTPVGGETCESNPPRTDCPNTLLEMEMLHWSFINNGYHPDVLNDWVSGGCMDTIRLRLGYRLVLTEAVVPQAVRPGGAFDLQVQLRNDGFAAMYNPRPVFVVLDAAGGRYGTQLENVDPRGWASGTAQTIRARLRLPSSLPNGTYRLSLWLPDQASTLRNSPAYAVRFANTQIWDASSGLNVLTTNFNVAADAPGFDDPTALELRPLD